MHIKIVVAIIIITNVVVYNVNRLPKTEKTCLVTMYVISGQYYNTHGFKNFKTKSDTKSTSKQMLSMYIIFLRVYGFFTIS